MAHHLFLLPFSRLSCYTGFTLFFIFPEIGVMLSQEPHQGFHKCFMEKREKALHLSKEGILMLNKLFLLISLLFITPLFAAPDLQHNLTISELVDIALENHSSTKQAWWNAKRAAAVLGSAKSAYYPSIGLESFITHGRDFKFINGPDTNYTIVGADLLLSLMLFDFGERNANVRSAKMALLAANWQVDWTIQQVIVGVLENAYQMLHSQEVLWAARISLEESEKMLDAALELNRAGLNPISDVYIAQAVFSQMKMELIKKKSLRDIQNGNLASSLGLDPGIPLELSGSNNIQLTQMQGTSELISLALQQRADLMAKRANLSEAIANQAKARVAYAPKLSFAGRGGANHAFRDRANALQYEVSLNLGIPLFNGFETMYQNRFAFADAKLSREELNQLELDISLEVLTNSRLLEANQEMLPVADEDLNNSVKAYESVLERYQAGKERITEVSIAQKQLAEARVRYSDIKTQWLVSIARLAYATGTLAPYLEKQCPENP
jgi:outer membrane protein